MKEARTVKKNHEFRRMYQKGRSSVNSYLVLYVRPNRRGCNRLGVTASTKLGKAVVRNRVKRRLREVWRLNDAHLKQGYDMILVARGRSVRGDFREIEKAYLRAAGELKLLEQTR
ncbi:MAG: ribonuclease P protein component [Oscillospiraceae bacterium]|nr:ribonuclease P protein component [Oscillospiraceae bacterium]MBR6678636.1 ribonuclease P protein component [Oscillospiraceae bacterium]